MPLFFRECRFELSLHQQVVKHGTDPVDAEAEDQALDVETCLSRQVEETRRTPVLGHEQRLGEAEDYPARRRANASASPTARLAPAATALSCDLFTMLMPRTESAAPHIGVSATTALTMPAAYAGAKTIENAIAAAYRLQVSGFMYPNRGRQRRKKGFWLQ